MYLLLAVRYHLKLNASLVVDFILNVLASIAHILVNKEPP